MTRLAAGSQKGVWTNGLSTARGGGIASATLVLGLAVSLSACLSACSDGGGGTTDAGVDSKVNRGSDTGADRLVGTGGASSCTVPAA